MNSSNLNPLNLFQTLAALRGEGRPPRSPAMMPGARPGLDPFGPDVNGLMPEQAVSRFIRYAIDLGASDLYFVANAGNVGALVRHLGLVRPIGAMPSDVGRRALAYIKTNARIDTTERRRPLDGRWDFDTLTERSERDGTPTPVEAGVPSRVVDLRISVIPTLYGEDFAIRLLRRDTKLIGLESLGFSDEQFGHYQTMLESPSGLILITGPTGSGKTATLYASLVSLAHSGPGGMRKINTIEDPIEFSIEGLRQSQVNTVIGLTFAEMLRGVLRQSPDVIMVGEIRDPETAETAVLAANSGVLVFATLHAPRAAGAVQSMRSLGNHPHFLATSLRGVIAQRLVRTLCSKCRIPFDISDAPHVFEEVRSLLHGDEGKTLYASAGCPACNMTGYAGRTGVYELMPIDPAIRDLIAANEPAAAIHTKAVEHGMLDFRRSALLKVARGITSTEEVFRIIPTEQLVNV